MLSNQKFELQKIGSRLSQSPHLCKEMIRISGKIRGEMSSIARNISGKIRDLSLNIAVTTLIYYLLIYFLYFKVVIYFPLPFISRDVKVGHRIYDFSCFSFR